MDARQLRILRELGELGSVSAVAAALHITPSAVSQQLKALQRRAAVPLTRRAGRFLRLTEAGERLSLAGAEVETALARAREIAQALGEDPQGTVHVSAFNSAAMAFFPPLVAAFPAGAAVEVRMADEDVAQAEFPKLTSTYDVVLAHRFAHTPPWPASVHGVALVEEPLDVALPIDHPLADEARITARRAAAEPWITTHAGFPVGAIVDALSAVTGHPVDVVHRVNEFTVAGELVRAGAGIALMPRWTSPGPPGVVLRPLDGVRSVRHIDALVRPENIARPAVRAVLDTLRDTGHRLRAGSIRAGG